MELYEECEVCFPVKNRAITQPHGQRPCRLMIIGQAPSLDEDLPSPRNALELSIKARWFLKMLKELGANPSDFYFTNLVKCSSKEQGKEGKPADCFEKYLRMEIHEVKPERIVVLGSRARRFLKSKYPEDKRLKYAWHPAQRRYTREQYRSKLKEALTS